MSNDLPQAQGWIDAHKDLVDRAAAALTVEHLGCTEWNDSTDRGYHATGRAELFAVWTTQGKMFDTVRDAVVAHDLPRTALLRPPAQFGVGGPSLPGPESRDRSDRRAGTPLTVSANGDGQVRRAPRREADRVPRGPRPLRWTRSTRASCARRPGAREPGAERQHRGVERNPEARGLRASGEVRGSGRVRPSAGAATGATSCWPRVRRHDARVTVELRRRGRVLARSKEVTVDAAGRRLVLRHPGEHAFPPGSYTVVVRHAGTRVARRPVRAK